MLRNAGGLVPLDATVMPGFPRRVKHAMRVSGQTMVRLFAPRAMREKLVRDHQQHPAVVHPAKAMNTPLPDPQPVPNVLREKRLGTVPPQMVFGLPAAVATARQANIVTVVFRQLAKIAPIAASHRPVPLRARLVKRGATTQEHQQLRSVIVLVPEESTLSREVDARTVRVDATDHNKRSPI